MKDVYFASNGGTFVEPSAAMTADGAVYVAGAFQGTVDFGTGPLTSAAGTSSLFLVRINPSGEVAWSKSIAGKITPWKLAADANGGVVMAGSFQDTVDLGQGSVSSPYRTSAFVVKYDSGGQLSWSKSFGVSGDTFIRGVGVTRDGGVLLAGTFESSVDFGGGNLTSNPGAHRNAFLARLDAQGGHQWSRRFEGAVTGTSNKNQFLEGVAEDADSNIYLWGTLQHMSIDFGGGALPIPSGDASSGFLAKLTPSGAHVFSKTVAGDIRDLVVAVGSNGASAFCAEAATTQTISGVAVSSFSNFCTRSSGDGSTQAPVILTTDGVHLGLSGGALMEDGRLFLATEISSTLTLLGTSLTAARAGSSGPEDVLLFELSNSNTLGWRQQAGDGRRQSPTSLAKSAAGLALVGGFEGQLDFGSGVLQGSESSRSVFVTTYGL